MKQDAFEEKFTTLLKQMDIYSVQLNHEYVALGFLIHSGYLTEITPKLDSIQKISNNLRKAQTEMTNLELDRFNQGSV